MEEKAQREISNLPEVDNESQTSCAISKVRSGNMTLYTKELIVKAGGRDGSILLDGFGWDDTRQVSSYRLEQIIRAWSMTRDGFLGCSSKGGSKSYRRI